MPDGPPSMSLFKPRAVCPICSDEVLKDPSLGEHTESVRQALPRSAEPIISRLDLVKIGT
jgi:hypothetical protein